MTSSQRTLVILGACGDLTARLLLPGLGQLLSAELPSHPALEGLQLIGVGAEELSDEQWRERVAASFQAVSASGLRVAAVLRSTRYLKKDVTRSDDLREIFGACTGEPALYFALPPAVTIAACSALAVLELPAGLQLALEKPFGTDLRTAKKLNRQLALLLPEDRIHRVDHFLGKSTVLNVLGLRFANRIFEPIWSAQHIERVEIVFDEPLGLEGRAGYYDKAGALIDMIQSHLLLVLALVTMEAPSSLNPEELRGAMAQALRATRVSASQAPLSSSRDSVSPQPSRRARYTGGTIGSRKFLSYAKEPGVDPTRQTETLAELDLVIDNWRWAGVPFLLRSGKALAGARKEIVITFKPVPHLPRGFTGRAGPQQLRISLSPDELALDISINGEGNPFELDSVTLKTTFAPGSVGPYGEVLAGILSGDLTLAVRGDEVEECWRIVAPVLAAWKKDAVPLDEYRAGSVGPTGWHHRAR